MKDPCLLQSFVSIYNDADGLSLIVCAEVRPQGNAALRRRHDADKHGQAARYPRSCKIQLLPSGSEKVAKLA